MRAWATRLARRVQRRLTEPDYPLLALEVRPRALGVVRLARQRGRLELGSAVVQDLPEGCFAPTLLEPNILAPDGFRAALRAALERAGAQGATRVCLVLPDPAGRVVLLPAADVAGKRSAETAELVRFRLRKALPFDAREARLAYHRPGANAGQFPVVAMAQAVIDQYESVLHEAGLHAGLVELCGLVCLEAALHARPETEDRLVINWDDGYVSLLLVRAGRLAVVRTLALPGEAAAAVGDVQREAFNTLLYYRERLGGAGLAGVSRGSAVLRADVAGRLLAESLELAPEALDAWAPLRGGAHAPQGASELPGVLAPPLAALVGRAA